MKSESIVNRFKGRRIIIVGDPVADQFLSGTIARVSREAPVFILRHEETLTRPGGAANAAANIASLGGHPLLVGLVGRDREGELLSAALREAGVNTDYLVTSDKIRTTTKLRVLTGQQFAVRQQVIRIDYEPDLDSTGSLAEIITKRIEDLAPSAEAIIFSDYGYGSATTEIFPIARDISKKYSIPITVDSRFRLGDLRGATAATPNLEEARRLMDSEEFRSLFARDVSYKAFSDGSSSLISEEEVNLLRKFLQTEALLVTLGPQGILIARENAENAVKLDAVGPKEPVDVTGAGDTVIAAFTLALSAGSDFLSAARIANHAGGIVVMKKGTAVVNGYELAASLSASEVGQHHSATGEI